jgi:probable HAF family extracellular repeat protein
VVLFSRDAQLRIRITNKTEADRDFVWVVADNEDESRQPWIHATPPSISFDVLAGQTAQRDLKITNRGTGRLRVSDLDPGFPAGGPNELDVFPLPLRLAPNHTSTLRFEFHAQDELKDITIPQHLLSDDPGPFGGQGHNRDFVLGIRVRFPTPSVARLGSLGGSTDVPEGFLPFFFGATGVANSGVVIGHSRTPRDGTHAFRWTRQDGMLDLGTFGTAGANNRSVANGMSADGSIVLGNDLRGFRWTAATGIVFLTAAAPPSPMASRISSDGSVVAGVMGLINGGHAFRWTAATGIVDLGTLGGHESSVFGMSRDGLVLVGTSDLRTDVTPSPRHAFRWTAATGMVDLGTLGGQDSETKSTSDDGSVVVGSSNSASTLDTHAFRWTAATGMVDLGTLGGIVSQGLLVSRDGAVVAGHSLLPSMGRAAFRWTAATGMIDLGNLGDDNRVMEITGMSADGSVIVGHAMRSPGSAVKRPYRWTAATGMRELNSLLASANIDMTGIELKQVTGVSDNGRFMVGLGTFASEVGMPYIVDFAPT